MVLSGHVRDPKPGDYPNVPNYNGVGYVNCSVQSWTTLCTNPYRPIQMLSDFQGQGYGGFFGFWVPFFLYLQPFYSTLHLFSYFSSLPQTPTPTPPLLP